MNESGTIALTFGDNTDEDTFDSIFRDLIGQGPGSGYVVAVNGVDIQVEDTRNDQGTPGLLGLLWNDELGEAEPGNEKFFAWEDIESVVIY
jgi:hypothetical protein